MAEKTVSLWVPLAYAALILTSFIVFSKFQRERQRARLANTQQFYPNNFARDIYLQLKGREKVPPKLLKSALIAWGAEDFTRLLRFKDNEPVMNTLMQSGLIGDSTLERFTGSQVLNTKELSEIAAEAVRLDPEWGQISVATISDVAQQHGIRRRVANLDVFKNEYYELAGTAPHKATAEGTTKKTPTIAEQVEIKKFRK